MGRAVRAWWAGLGRVRQLELVGALLALLLLLLFARLARELFAQELVQFDTSVIGWVQSYRSPGMTAFMRVVTSLGSPLLLTVAALLSLTLLYRRGHRWEPLALLLSLVGGWLWDEVLKRLFQRPRPLGPWLASASGFSFPSGHSVVAVTFYGVMALLLIRYLRSGALRFAAVGVSLLLVGLIGISRIYLGVHYPSDVLGGYALGGAWAIICLVIAGAWDRRRARLER